MLIVIEMNEIDLRNIDGSAEAICKLVNVVSKSKSPKVNLGYVPPEDEKPKDMPKKEPEAKLIAKREPPKYIAREIKAKAKAKPVAPRAARSAINLLPTPAKSQTRTPKAVPTVDGPTETDEFIHAVGGYLKAIPIDNVTAIFSTFKERELKAIAYSDRPAVLAKLKEEAEKFDEERKNA